MCKNMPPLELAIQFHGHICPGLLMGVRAAEFALEKLSVDPDVDEELVAVVETDSCGVDAIQSILGCTFGKGNLIFRDFGKNVYTIGSREKNQAIRIAQRYGVKFNPDWPRYKELSELGSPTQEELQEKESILGAMFEKVMTMPFEELFKWEEVAFEMPGKAQIVETVQCQKCGEGVMKTRTVSSDGGLVCLSCAAASEVA
ncbi:MAG: FmdE family protein [Syntrophomonadaceae bacterium]